MMDKNEILRRLREISKYAVHTPGELPLILSLDDGLALSNAANLIVEQELKIEELAEKLRVLEYGNQDALKGNIMPAT